MPQKYLNALINAFGRLPQRVVWKWDSDTQPENLPANILMATWLPQQDLLGHGQARLFITHGGLLGMQEATYHGVPLLALPFATDQNMNAAKANKEGPAFFCSFATLTPGQMITLRATLQVTASNSSGSYSTSTPCTTPLRPSSTSPG